MDHESYVELAMERSADIVRLYLQFAEKQPVMLYDVQDGKIYAYPYVDFKAELSAGSQDILKDQYEEAVREEKIVVFVRDNEKQKLISFCLA